MLSPDRLLIRDDSPENIEYCQPSMPEMGNGDIWHCTTSHRTYMCVEGTQGEMFNSIIEIDVPYSDCGTRFDCRTPHLESRNMAAPPPCNGLCVTGSDIGVPSNEIAYAHPECLAHGSCTCPAPPIYDVNCPVHGRKPSQTLEYKYTVGSLPPLGAIEGDTWYQPETQSRYVRRGINWVREA